MIDPGAGGPRLALTLSHPRPSFIGNWNAPAVKYHSLAYQKFITAAGHAAGTPMPAHLELGRHASACMAGVFMLFVYTYCVVYVGGEVKRPDGTLLRAQRCWQWPCPPSSASGR